MPREHLVVGRPGLSAIKTLFAHSCNRCAFPGCDNRLTDPSWNGVRADLAHIRGEKPGAARYAPDMSDEERNAVDNLMLLCPNHHREIDRLRPQDWPADRLMEIKFEHEQRCSRETWATEPLLEYYSSLLASIDAEQATESSAAPPPRLVVEAGERNSFFVVNVSDSDAFNVSVTTPPDVGERGLLRLEEGVVARLSPGGRWRAGVHFKTFGNAGVAVVRVKWSDEGGRQYDADFTL